jgi:hypothetical protein
VKFRNDGKNEGTHPNAEKPNGIVAVPEGATMVALGPRSTVVK